MKNEWVTDLGESVFVHSKDESEVLEIKKRHFMSLNHSSWRIDLVPSGITIALLVMIRNRIDVIFCQPHFDGDYDLSYVWSSLPRKTNVIGWLPVGE